MAPTSDDSKPEQNPGEDDQDLTDEKFHALVSGLSLDQSAPTDYLDILARAEVAEGFTPPEPEKIQFFTSIKEGMKAFKKWKDNPRKDNTDLDDDGAQI
ncbi:hypothetical protein GM50_6205 [freshwater metagenome]|jgi:hypothetical protein|uniref:Uncharacterized protein n=1 Tax=freshwater metagenome TaxID=449393 RepID=A0A094SKX9_9ZZZZ